MLKRPLRPRLLKTFGQLDVAIQNRTNNERNSFWWYNIWFIMRRLEKRSEGDKNSNYKALISQYYERDPHLSDIKFQVKSITPEIDILDELTEFEKKIDGLIKTKRYDVQEMHMKPPQKIKRLLRVAVTREEQSGQQSLKIYGWIHPKKEETSSCKFTSFFRQIVLSSKDSPLETWKKPIGTFQEKDGVIIKLPHSHRDTLTISLTPIHIPAKFTVDSTLQKIVGMKHGTRVQILDAFWLYIKTNKLQDVDNKEIINADDLIRTAFKTEKLTFATINSRVRELLVPMEGVRITLLGSQKVKMIDIVVDIEQKPNIDIVPFFSQKLNEEKNDHPYLSLMGKIKKYDTKFKDYSEKLRRHLLKRDLYKNFTPEKIQEIITEQHLLLQILKKTDPVDSYNRLEFILENEDELQREVKHYFENLNSRTD